MTGVSLASLAEAMVHALVKEAADPPTTLAALAAVTEQIATRLGLRDASCWRISRAGQPTDPELLFGKGDAGWAETYGREGFLHVDPVVQLIFRRALPF